MACNEPMLPDKVRLAIRKILDYLWQDEMRSFEDSHFDQQGEHIGDSLIIVKAWLDESGAKDKLSSK